MKAIKKILPFIMGTLILLFQYSAYADDNVILVTSESSEQSDIVSDVEQFEILVDVSNINDIYAFTIDLDYDNSKIEIISISSGDIFSEYGSAVLTNSVDNDLGQASFMQTLLSVDTGVSDKKTLCIIEVSIKDGEYNFEEDFGAEIKIANSTPEYIDAYISDTKITVNYNEEEATASNTSAPESTATPSPQLGVVTPVPESEQDSNFVVAEDESIEEIIEEIQEDEKKAEDAQIALEEKRIDEASSKAATQTSESIATQDNLSEETQTQKISTELLILIIVLAVFIPTIIISLIIYFKRKASNQSPADESNQTEKSNHTRRR